MARRAILWFRNDLRLHDNQLFHYPEVLQAKELVALYCVDPRHYESSKWGEHARTAPHRAKFLAETLDDLSRSLVGIGSQLFTVEGRPEDVIPALAQPGDVLAFQREDTYEETRVEDAVMRMLPEDVTLLRHWGHTLYNRDDLGWDPRETLPIPFGKFKFGVCDQISPRPELPPPRESDLPKPPSVETLECFSREGMRLVPANAKQLLASMTRHQTGVYDYSMPMGGEAAISWHGGESAGLLRLEEYVVPEGLGTYHRTRNQLQGANHSSHLSPWIANGSLSPRVVYWRVKEFEKLHAGSEKDQRFDHVYKFIFELSWRDYFRFYCARFGSSVFFLGGPAKRSRSWRRDADAEACWKQGRTGVPLIDALMRELLATGFMSNRGRYVVASYLVHYLGIDWRVGADWFESLLLDHDVCSNYGEWASMAGVAAAPSKGQPLGLKGRGPSSGRSSGARGSGGNPWAKGTDTGDAVFDPWEQAAQYDRTESFVRKWVPELRRVPKGLAHWPHDMGEQEWYDAGCGDYPAPVAVEPFRFAKDQGGPTKSVDSETKEPRRAKAVLVSAATVAKRARDDASDRQGDARNTVREVGYIPSATASEAHKHHEGGRRRWKAKNGTTRCV